MLLLKSADVDGQVVAFPLFKDRLRIGRDPSADIVLLDKDVSRFHALLAVEGGRLIVSDTRSTNGVFVNNVRIHDPAPLKLGDLLIIGSNLFVVAEEDRGADALGQTIVARPPDEFAAADEAAAPSPAHPAAFERTILRDKAELLEGAFAKKTQVARFPRLLVSGDDLADQCYLLTMPALRIGRAADCHVRLPSMAVSARHAEIRVRSEGNWLVDLDSDAGTRVNGARVQQHKLRDHDAIELPGARLIYRHEEGLRGKVSEFLKSLFE